MPRLTMIESPNSLATQTTAVDGILPASSSPQHAQVVSNKLATAQRKTAAGRTAAPVNASRSTAKSRSRRSVGSASQPTSKSCRKQKWNALVRNSAPLTLNSDDNVTGASSTQSRENKIAAATACSTKRRRTTDCNVNNSCSSAACRKPSSFSSQSRQARLSVGLSYKTKADGRDARECRHCCASHDGRSVVSPMSSFSTLSATSSTPSSFSSSRLSSRKRRRLDVDCPTTTKYGRCHDDESCRLDRHHSRCGYCHLRHFSQRRRCSTCQSERYRRYDDSRRAFHDQDRYGTPSQSYWRSAGQSAAKQPFMDPTLTNQCVFRRAGFNLLSYVNQTPDTICHSRIVGFDGLSIKQEPVDDSFDARLPTIDGSNCHPTSYPRSSSFLTHSNNAADRRSSSTLGDRSIPTSCTIPLEPVSGAPLSTDPRQPRQRQPAAGVTTNVHDLEVEQPDKVKRITFLIQGSFLSCRNYMKIMYGYFHFVINIM